jgi:hypothetical protein
MPSRKYPNDKRTQKPPLAKSILVSAAITVVGVIGWVVVAASLSGKPENWTVVNAGSYSVSIPDGWSVYHALGSDGIIDNDCVSCLRYKAGTRAQVTTSPQSAQITNGMLKQFYLRPQTDNEAGEAAFFGTYKKEGTIAAKNASGTKYTKTTTDSSDAGLWPGTKIYGYALSKGNNVIFITHTVGPGGDDRREDVERLISTLELK